MKRTAEGSCSISTLFSRPFHGLRHEIPLVPAMNRWAIVSRPLARTGNEARVPERRFIVSSGVSTQLGRTWSQPSRAFAKLRGSLETHWFPQASGDDYEMQGKIRAGRTFGEIPFDELFVLGVERDNDLWLRAHIGTRDGRKGSAPMGRNYFLSNWEFDKNIYSNSLIPSGGKPPFPTCEFLKSR